MTASFWASLVIRGVLISVGVLISAEQTMQRGLLLDAVGSECAAIFELLARFAIWSVRHAQRQTLKRIRLDALLISDFRLDVVHGVALRNVECDDLPVKVFHEDLKATRAPKDAFVRTKG